MTGNDKSNEVDHLIQLEAWQCKGTHGSVRCPALRDLWMHKISPLIVNKEAKPLRKYLQVAYQEDRIQAEWQPQPGGILIILYKAV